MDMDRMWDGYGVDMKWIRMGYDMHLEWIRNGYGIQIEWVYLLYYGEKGKLAPAEVTKSQSFARFCCSPFFFSLHHSLNLPPS